MIILIGVSDAFDGDDHNGSEERIHFELEI